MNGLFTKYNLIGFALKIIGLIIIPWGIIRSIVIAEQVTRVSQEYGEGYPALDISIFFTPIILGALIIGFGEVIDLLQKIHDQNEPEIETEKDETHNSTAFMSIIPFSIEHELKGFYANKEMEITSILPTKDRDIFIVTVENRTEVIETGGFSPRLLSKEEAEKYL